jgi:multidrug resistance efflux pump
MVRDNQFVHAGDILFEIDPRTFEASLEQAEAQYDMSLDSYHALVKQVDAAQAYVGVSQANVLQAASGIKQEDAQIVKNKAEYSRQKQLLPQKATSKKSVERARANYDVSLEEREGAIASFAQAQAALVQSEADLAKARASLGALGDNNASVRQARAAMQQAQLNLEFTQVKATVDGYVSNLNLRLGSQAVANQPALALVDINSFWISGNFRETWIENIRIGNKAMVTLMAYPDTPVEGYVDSLGWGIGLQDGSTGFELLPNINPTFEWIRLAQRVPVRIHFDTLPEGVKLRVGMTATVLVKTGSD